MGRKKILFLFGTRPEAIKMAPLIRKFRENGNFEVRTANTGQHREMLDQVTDFFEIASDFSLNIMQPGQTLAGLTEKLIGRISSEVLEKENFDMVVVQGDTTTVMMGAMAAFYNKIPVMHLEAGLRSHNMHSPFPEEMNRVLTSRLSEIHLCPTEKARENLEKEGITENVHVVGNTVIDALFLGLSKLPENTENEKNQILVTCHRRENHGAPFRSICSAIQEIAEKKPEFEIIYPVHLNPNIKEFAHTYLTAPNIKLVEPLDYRDLIAQMNNSYLILTDSGGIQEEAPSLGKPVIVLRDVTERTEGIEAGNAILVGTEKEKIVRETLDLIDNKERYEQISQISNPYGDGKASERIVEIVQSYFKMNEKVQTLQ